MDVKKIAVQTAKKYQTWNPYEIAEARGVQIIYAPLKSILGYYTKYKRIQCIILNDNLPSPLQRFVCAHELGHSICHTNLNTQWLRKTPWYRQTESNAKPVPLPSNSYYLTTSSVNIQNTP